MKITLKRLVSILIILLENPCVACAQQTLSIKDHRLYVVSSNILVGDFELTYSWKAGNNLFFEPSLGYHYFPFSIKQNGFAIGIPGYYTTAVPELGLAYNGPYIRFGIMSYLNIDKTSF